MGIDFLFYLVYNISVILNRGQNSIKGFANMAKETTIKSNEPKVSAISSDDREWLLCGLLG
mgnify:CR=1 FL=1